MIEETKRTIDCEGVIEQRDLKIRWLEREVHQLKEEIGRQNEALQALSHTIVEKGETNRQLSEVVNSFKN